MEIKYHYIDALITGRIYSRSNLIKNLILIFSDKKEMSETNKYTHRFGGLVTGPRIKSKGKNSYKTWPK